MTDDVAVFTEIGPWWNAQRGPMTSPFLRSEWFETWAKTRLRSDEHLYVVLVNDGSRIRAAIPLIKKGLRLRSMSDGSSEVFDLVYEPDPEAVEVLIQSLGRETHVVLDRVEGSSPLVSRVAGHPGWKVQRTLGSPYLDMERSIEDIEESLGRNLRRNLRRAMRRLEGMGEVRILPAVTEDISGTLARAYELESRGWKGERGRSVLDDPQREAFFTSMAHRAAELGWLRLGTLEVDQKLVSYNYDLEYDGRMFGILTSYDETIDPRSSPGSVLFWACIEDEVARGIRSYEMGGDAANEWKMMWTDLTRERVDIAGFGSSLRGRVADRMASLKRRMR